MVFLHTYSCLIILVLLAALSSGHVILVEEDESRSEISREQVPRRLKDRLYQLIANKKNIKVRKARRIDGEPYEDGLSQSDEDRDYHDNVQDNVESYGKAMMRNGEPTNQRVKKRKQITVNLDQLVEKVRDRLLQGLTTKATSKPGIKLSNRQPQRKQPDTNIKNFKDREPNIYPARKPQRTTRAPIHLYKTSKKAPVGEIVESERLYNKIKLSNSKNNQKDSYEDYVQKIPKKVDIFDSEDEKQPARQKENQDGADNTRKQVRRSTPSKNRTPDHSQSRDDNKHGNTNNSNENNDFNNNQSDNNNDLKDDNVMKHDQPLRENTFDNNNDQPNSETKTMDNANTNSGHIYDENNDRNDQNNDNENHYDNNSNNKNDNVNRKTTKENDNDPDDNNNNADRNTEETPPRRRRTTTEKMGEGNGENIEGDHKKKSTIDTQPHAATEFIGGDYQDIPPDKKTTTEDAPQYQYPFKKRPPKRIVTNMQIRQRFTIVTPNYYDNLPRIAVTYNFDEPLPDRDQEDVVRAPKVPLRVPSVINGKVKA